MSKLIILLSLISASVFAGSTVCSNGDIYYSDVQFDMGILPPPGYVLGHLTIVHKQKVLVKTTKLNDLGGYLHPTHFIEFDNNSMVTLDEAGNSTAGSKIYKINAKLIEAPFPTSSQKVIAHGSLVCEKKWAMVP